MDMSKFEGKGLRVYPHGIVYQSDRRIRVKTQFVGDVIIGAYRAKDTRRGPIKAFSCASLKRLAFVFANAGVELRSLVTLTYHAASDQWNDPERNKRIVERSKKDLNRFLTAMRAQFGAYLWVQEFQKRGVVHYHLVCEKELFEPEVRMVWCRTIGALDDAAARMYGAKVDIVRDQEKVRKYLAFYLGKGRQKSLPSGIDGAGRWWGASRSVQVMHLGEAVSWSAGAHSGNGPETRIVRALRRFVSRIVGFKYRGGVIVDWGGGLSARTHRALLLLSAYYGESPELMLARFGWTRAEGA